jgi:hypothetical protein
MTDFQLAEITLRKYENPYQSDKRELCKKICLSLGLLQPGDSRDIIVDILAVLLESKSKKEELETGAIKEKAIALRKKSNLELSGIADSNIRRQLKRLKDIFLIEKTNSGYRISEFENLGKIFEEKIEKFLVPSIVARIKEYMNQVEK